jgi:hypothetical protein
MFMAAPRTNNLIGVVGVLIKFSNLFSHSFFVAARAEDVPARIGAELFFRAAIVATVMFLAAPDISLRPTDFALSHLPSFPFHPSILLKRRI